MVEFFFFDNSEFKELINNNSKLKVDYSGDSFINFHILQETATKKDS